MLLPRPSNVLLDAQLLVLLVVGLASKTYIGKHKRLAAYDLFDFELLLEFLEPPSRAVVTPNVLTEASNLVGHIGEPARTGAFLALRAFIGSAAEIYVPSSVAASHRAFTRLGLADSACLVADAGTAMLRTADLQLYLEAERSGRPVVNFRHLRDAD